MAMAEDVTLTTGIEYTNAEGSFVISALNSDASDWVGKETNIATTYGIGNSFANWPNAGGAAGSVNTDKIQVTVTLSGLYNASALDGATAITLNSFAYLGNASGWCEDEGRTLTISVNGTEQTKTMELQAIRPAGSAWLTMDDIGFTVTKDSVLTMTLAPASTKDTDNLSMAVADIYKTGSTTAVAWSGVSTVDINPNWSNEGPLVKLGLTTVPEPTTVTLSLLALAGLAARRKRH